jgi:ribonuclease HII
MSARQRDQALTTIQDVALAWGIGNASSREIDEAGINLATR